MKYAYATEEMLSLDHKRLTIGKYEYLVLLHAYNDEVSVYYDKLNRKRTQWKLLASFSLEGKTADETLNEITSYINQVRG